MIILFVRIHLIISNSNAINTFAKNIVWSFDRHRRNRSAHKRHTHIYVCKKHIASRTHHAQRRTVHRYIQKFSQKDILTSIQIYYAYRCRNTYHDPITDRDRNNHTCKQKKALYENIHNHGIYITYDRYHHHIDDRKTIIKNPPKGGFFSKKYFLD